MNILVISPHPDDETLGAGGSLLKFKDNGHNTFWLNVTNRQVDYGYSSTDIVRINDSIEKVRNMYNFDGFWDLKLEPACMDRYTMGELVTRFKGVLDEIKPDIMLIPYWNDVHSDHRVIFDAVYSCTKSFRAPYLKTVLCMEILSETDQGRYDKGFVPNVYINITDYIDEKIKVLSIYENEIGDPPFPRNTNAVRGLAAYRGATAYYEYAEAFCMIKGRLD